MLDVASTAAAFGITMDLGIAGRKAPRELRQWGELAGEWRVGAGDGDVMAVT